MGGEKVKKIPKMQDFAKFVLFGIFDEGRWGGQIPFSNYTPNPPKSLHKLLKPENISIADLLWIYNIQRVPKSRITGHEQFIDPLSYSKTQFATNKVHSRVHILLKVSINQYYRKLLVDNFNEPEMKNI